MKIDFRKKQLNINLIFGIIWLVYFLVRLNIGEMHWIDYGWIFIALAYFINYYYQKRYKYVTIQNNVINVNGPFGKKLNLKDIKQIRRFAGDLIIKSENKELVINTQVIEPEMLKALYQELEKLDIEWT